MISQQEYQARRKNFMQRLPEGSIAIIPAAHESLRNGDAHYRFRQESNFYYLTGFNEPESLLILISGKDSQSILFNRPRNPMEEQWTGRRLGQDGALSELAMDAAFPIGCIADELPKLLIGKTAIYYALARNSEVEKIIMQALDKVKSQVRRGVKVPEQLCDLEPILGEMRLFKSDAELELMRRAARISVKAHEQAMRRCKHLEYEYQLEAELLYEFSRQGCRSVAYDPIVGGGENACILHYTNNNKPLRQGDLVLIDAGGEYENYAADITRTFPVNGEFSLEQKSIYELVLKAQKAGIAVVKPGLPWNEIQKVMLRILTEGLCGLGILQGNVEELLAKEAYKPFYMHNSGHWLGLDVHDIGLYKINGEWRPLEPGMVLTVEPGLYISSNTPGVDKRWWGIGVRIEDDVVVTKTGHEVITAALPVDVHEIEALMRD
ncbi:Xaa-Pro aminopeptidase [Legionella longbeachae]|uniref:Xaa-Pro aminopeptidase n=1 Tax=Legionella longbeachae serogroup 1 (strain NSW150) TaxID=661367 RepID=D3HMV3_LEGLN|nr:Xaa-Pro aminopeptidase [Legionella longbeachae]VEE04306.1 proline aminopeptidase P II [Legionella oakridgensis]HBD7397075.1 Xaa-Pro aminopeptidase [Legionella pneumophila]ARB92872.1 Xaa-Pro aminopeptidase [Legionella longbeachae]ARM33988.1 Xaa-Pro aminopeptidase [Legionella longbeachae]EEZ96799.1 X-Pro aminopeptidase [Legionella longbeachae D-4968]